MNTDMCLIQSLDFFLRINCLEAALVDMENSQYLNAFYNLFITMTLPSFEKVPSSGLSKHWTFMYMISTLWTGIYARPNLTNHPLSGYMKYCIVPILAYVATGSMEKFWIYRGMMLIQSFILPQIGDIHTQLPVHSALKNISSLQNTKLLLNVAGGASIVNYLFQTTKY